MPDNCIYIDIDDYLFEWLSNLSEGESTVYFPKLSIENRILQTFLTEKPRNISVIKENVEGKLKIGIPKLKNVDPNVHNFLPRHAKLDLIDNIRNRFIIQFWDDIHRTCNIGKRKDNLIIAFMEKCGITVNDTNYNSLHKIYQRQRWAYYKRVQRAKTKKAKKRNI